MVTDEEKIRYLIIRGFPDVRDADARKAEAKKRAEKAKKANQANLEPAHRRRTYPRIADHLTDQIEVVVIEFKARKAEQRMEEAARKDLATAYERELNELASDELDSRFQAERRRSGAVRARYVVAPQAGKSAQSERRSGWVIKRVGGNKWRCGIETDLKLINGTEGLEDLCYAVQRNGEDCDPLERLAISDSDIAAARALKYHTAADVIDPKARSDISARIEDLEAAREIAREQSDIEAEQNADEQLAEIKQHLKNDLRPDGRPRKLTAGDPYRKAIKAMRGRIDTVLKNLRNAELNEMADHIDKCYVLSERSFAYHGSSLKVIP